MRQAQLKKADGELNQLMEVDRIRDADGKKMMAKRMAPHLNRLFPANGRGEARKEMEQIALPPMPVRVFAHPCASGPAEERYDFAETLYWHPVLVLDGGKAEVSFDLCDSLGAFEVTAFAHTLDGRLGAATQVLTSRLPFTVQPRTPLEVTAGDKIDIALAIANNTRESRTAHVSVTEHANLSLGGSTPAADVSVPAEASIRKLYRFQPTIQEGTATLHFTGKADGFPADSVRTTFRIVPEGFPMVASHSDVLEKSATHDVVLPDTWIKGTLKCQVQVYPSTLADLQKGLEALLARAVRLLRANLDEQLSEPAHPALPQGERSDQAGSREPRPRVARPRLSDTDFVRVYRTPPSTPRKATSGSAARPPLTRR